MARVLLVEDCTDVLFVLQLELESMGYTMDVASNGTAAVELAKKNRPDIIVSDIGMPDMDGLEFIKRIREIPTLVNVPAVALTGYSLPRDTEQALAFGFNKCLTKPVEAAQLARMIELFTVRRLERKAG